MTSAVNLVSQAEFARLVGVSRSYITKLKADGRLVIGADGVVDVEASKRRIIETADPNRDDVVARWAKARGETAVAAGKEPEADEPDADKPDADKPEADEPEADEPKADEPKADEPKADEPKRPTYADARARKESASADIAEMERDKLRGQLVERAAVEAAVEDVMTIVRQALEQQPHRVAPMLVGQDLDAIRATLKQENNNALAGMVREFQQRIRQMAGEEE